MDDSARGMATQILCDMLNIGVHERAAESGESTKEDQHAEESISETASITSSLSSSPRKPRQALSDVSITDGDASEMSISLEPVKQIIKLPDDDNSRGVCIYGNQVDILQNEENRLFNTAASNKIKFNAMVNYDWDLKYYRGNLLAYGTKFIAYALKGRSGYVLRILSPETATRALIKGFTGQICDLAFAHSDSRTLACVDEGGDLYVWNISEQDGKIEYAVKLHIKQTLGSWSDYHRLCWCPFLPDEGEQWNGENSSDECRLLAVTHDNQVEVIDFETVVSRCGSTEISVDSAREGDGFVTVKDGHTKPITDMALSPDGAVLTTASDDGYVKFWKLSDNLSSPAVRIHEFKPHDGSPVSYLKFCDNYTARDQEVPMWRFLITGTELNREIKVWCTVSWTCLQTVRFSSLPNVSENSSAVAESALVAHLDSSASYLVLSDITKKVLYILMLHQNLAEGRAHFTSVSEFPLTQPLLSFVVCKAKMFNVRQDDEDSPHENGERYSLEETSETVDEGHIDVGEPRRMFGVQLQLYGILTRSMQELLIHFNPQPSVSPLTLSTLSSLATLAGEPGLRDALSDLSGMDTGTETSTDVDESDGTGDIPACARRPKLITPDAFTRTVPKSPNRPESSNGSVTSVSSLNQSQRSAVEFSSTSSRLSESTLRFSVQEGTRSPQGSFADESLVMTPTSLPLPLTPPPHFAPDPSAVPIPMFGSCSPESSALQELEPQATSPAQVNTERDPGMGDFPKGVGISSQSEGSASPEVDNRPRRPSIDEREADVILEDEAKEAEYLPEAQKPGAEGQEEGEPSFGASASVNLSPQAGPLIDLAFEEPAEDTCLDVQSMQSERNEGVPTGRESPESADAIPVTVTPPMLLDMARAWVPTDLVASPVSLVDIPPEPSRAPQRQDYLVLAKLTEILTVVQSQGSEIVELRQQLSEQQTRHRQEVAALVHEEVQALGEAITSRVHKSVAEHSREETQRLEKVIRDKQSSEKKRHEQLQNSLSQTLTSALTGKLDKTVKAEIKAATNPAVQKFLVSLQEQLNATITQKLTAADSVLKDSIGKMVRSKGVVDAIGTAASTALQGPIQATYTDAFKNTVLPSFEHSCQVMFQQINNAFQTGTQQYMQQVMSSLESQRHEQRERQAPVTQQLQAQAHVLQELPDRLCSAVSSDLDIVLQKQLTASLDGLREDLLSRVQSQVVSSVQDVIRAEIRDGLHDIKEQISEVMASTEIPATPVDTAHQQMTISSHIQAGEIEKAFKVALSAADLRLVIYVCSFVNSTELFSENQLSPPVLLSLIQQLSVDLTADTDIKQKFLEEALMNLDASDDITRKHMPAVLQGLCQQLQEALRHAPGPMHRNLKMLLMAANSLLK